MRTETTDEQLMLRLAGGQDDALGELMRRHEAPIWCLIRRMCGYLDCTDDVYQEVWTRVFLYRGRYKPLMLFRPYLFSIAVNCCRTAMRRGQGRRRATVFLESAEDLGETRSDPGPLADMIAGEDGELLHGAIARLPEAERTVVLLYLLLDSDYRMIAGVLGKAVGTVRSQMFHAIRRLRSVLTRVSLPAGEVKNHERQPR